MWDSWIQLNVEGLIKLIELHGARTQRLGGEETEDGWPADTAHFSLPAVEVNTPSWPMCLATAASSHAKVKREFRKKQKARRDFFFNL